MADPLSITASVTGLLSVAGKVTTILSAFIYSVSDAPSSARAALAAVEEMRMVLSSVQKVMDTLSRLPRERKEMIHVRHLVVTFREAICSFSELEAMVNPANYASATRSPSKWDRVKWVLEEERIGKSVQRLEVHKNSLSTMLSILHCESGLEAQRHFINLEDMVRRVLDQNQALSRRLEEHGILCGAEVASIRFFDDDQSVIQGPSSSSQLHVSSSVPPTSDESIPLEAPIDGVIAPHDFELTLERTRVYRSVRSHDTDVSFRSSAVRTNAWSLLSGISLNDISIISVIGMPISLEEINCFGPDLTFAKMISAKDEREGAHAHAGLAFLESRPRPKATSSRWLVGFSARRNPKENKTPTITKPPTLRSMPVSERRVRPNTSHVGKMPWYKLVVLGDTGVGITALTIQFCFGDSVDTCDPTFEDSFRKQVSIDGEPCLVDVLDTTGQVEYAALRDQWIADGEGFLLVYSITSRASFTRVSKFYKQIESVKELRHSQNASLLPTEHRAQFYQPRPAYQSPSMMLVGNDLDRHEEREVSTPEGSVLAKDLGCDFVEASAKDGINVERAFFDVVRRIRRLQSKQDTPQSRLLRNGFPMTMEPQRTETGNPSGSW